MKKKKRSSKKFVCTPFCPEYIHNRTIQQKIEERKKENEKEQMNELGRKVQIRIKKERMSINIDHKEKLNSEKEEKLECKKKGDSILLVNI